MIISRRTKEATKTGLSMAIAYGIALQMDWAEPMWAGLAVAMISLATIGQSLNKAALRMLGTFVAAVVALIIIALFAQDRWPFILFLSAWVGFCTYMMGGTKNSYFWHVSAFACVIILVDGGINPVNAFDTAMLRTQQTALGILVYSLVTIFLWPSISHADFDKVTRQLISTQHQLYQAYIKLILGQNNADNAETIQTLRMQVLQQENQFVQLLAAAERESHEVSELAEQWGAFRDHVMELSETMERCYERFTEVQEFDIQDLLPNLTELSGEIDERFSQVSRMLAGEAPTQMPQPIKFKLNSGALNKLSYFQKAAITIFLTRLHSLEPLTRNLFATVSDIKGFASEDDDVSVASIQKPGQIVLPDRDRLYAVVNMVATTWLAYLAIIYVNDIPGGAGILSMGVPIGMMLATTPQLSVSSLIVPIFSSILLAGLCYVFLMPHLSSFFGLGLFIFLFTFTISYLFFEPQQRLSRAAALMIFLTITSITNEQSYSFLHVTSTGLMFVIVFLLLSFTVYIPFSPRPERVFLRLLSRFFHSSEYLISTLARDSQKSMTRLESLKQAFYMRELTTLPNKLLIWARLIETGTYTGTLPERVQALTTNLQALTYRTQELLETFDSSQAESVVQELFTDTRSWRLEIQNTFQHLSKDPAMGDSEIFCNKLTKIMDRVEERISGTANNSSTGEISPREVRNFYRMLGAFRGVSVALVNYVESTDVIDWTQWREERF